MLGSRCRASSTGAASPFREAATNRRRNLSALAKGSEHDGRLLDLLLEAEGWSSNFTVTSRARSDWRFRFGRLPRVTSTLIGYLSRRRAGSGSSGVFMFEHPSA